MCEKIDSTQKCLSTGECRVCQFVASNSLGSVNKYEGCDITSTSPVCDANTAESAAGIQYDTNDYNVTHTPGCVPCKKEGKTESQVQLYLDKEHQAILSKNSFISIVICQHWSTCLAS